MKLLSLLTVFFVALNFMSCKKDWDCVCDTDLENDVLVGEVTNAKNKDAEELCSDLETELEVFNCRAEAK